MSPSSITITDRSTRVPTDLALTIAIAIAIFLITYANAFLLASLVYHISRLTTGCSELLSRLESSFFAALYSILTTGLSYSAVRSIDRVVYIVKANAVALMMSVVVLLGLRRFWTASVVESEEEEEVDAKGEVLWRRILGIEKAEDHEKGV